MLSLFSYTFGLVIGSSLPGGIEPIFALFRAVITHSDRIRRSENVSQPVYNSDSGKHHLYPKTAQSSSDICHIRQGTTVSGVLFGDAPESGLSETK